MRTTKLFFILLISVAIRSSESQFNYPADENAPQFVTTFTCYACEGDGCGEVQDPMVANNTESCSATRVGCWILRNMNDGSYQRTCRKPASIRQGVFCNRHIDGREFCYGYDTPAGRVRICAKCCLNNRCNFGTLDGRPHPQLQTCVACDGSENNFCNNEITVRDMEDSTYIEQCLFPQSDCWKERRVADGKAVYQRGCQLLECNEDNVRENCTIHESIKEEKCQKCCENNLCNRLQFETPTVFSAATTTKSAVLSSRTILSLVISLLGSKYLFEDV